jgi:hypothetical protein
MVAPTERFTIDLRRLVFEHYDSCTICGYNFQEAEHSNSGYLPNNAPAYLCDRCSVNLAELAARRYFIPRPYEVPSFQSQLWRYMDFTKYVSLLSSRALYFSRADQFVDPHEGAKGLKSRKDVWDRHYLEFFREAVSNPPAGYESTRTDEEVEAEAKRLLADLEAGGKASRLCTFINCWHENDYESAAMWRLYSSFLPNAVAIQTSYESLYSALGRNPSIQIGRVRYLDLHTQYAGVNDAFWRKRKSFEHEREVRAIILDFEHRDIGKLVSCDVDSLIKRVYVSPEAPNWFISLVNDVNDKYALDVKVTASEFNEEPFF